MLLMLMRNDGKDIEATKKDMGKLQIAFDAYRKNQKHINNPFVISFIGYDVYAIPGVIEKVEVSDDGIVRLNVTELMRFTNEEIRESILAATEEEGTIGKIEEKLS